MQKDSICEKKKSRKRRSKKNEVNIVEEQQSNPVENEECDDEYADIDLEKEAGVTDTMPSEKLTECFDDDDMYEPSNFDVEEAEAEAEAERKKKAIEERKRIRRENKTINYVEPQKMLERIIEYYKTDVMSEELAMDIRRICDRLSMSSRFVNYTYREEMASDAFFSAYKAIYNKKFDITKGYNPFSYVTQVAFHSMVQRIKIEHKEREKTDSYREAHFDELLKETAAEANAANESFDSYGDYS